MEHIRRIAAGEFPFESEMSKETMLDDGTGAILGKPEMSKYYAFLEKIRGF